MCPNCIDLDLEKEKPKVGTRIDIRKWKCYNCNFEIVSEGI